MARPFEVLVSPKGSVVSDPTEAILSKVFAWTLLQGRRHFLSAVALLLLNVAFCLSGRAQVSTHSGVEGRGALRHSVKGFQITQRYKNTTLVTILSADGVASTHYTAEGKPVGGAILRYRDAMAFGLDYKDHAAHTLTLSRAVANKLAENAGMSTITSVPQRSGRQETSDRIRIVLNPPPVLSRTDLSAIISGLHAKAITIDKGGWKVRTWYSDELPKVPEAVARLLGRLVVDCASKRTEDDEDEPKHESREKENTKQASPCKSENIVLAQTLARIFALRTEIQINGNWMTAIDTTEVRRLTVSSETFNPPKDLRIVRVAARAQQIRRAGPGYDAVTTAQPQAPVSATVREGPGPLLAHLDVHHFYWGRMFSVPQNAGAIRELTGAYGGFFQATLYRPAYTHDLGQYGIGSGGGLKGVYFINDNPERAALTAPVNAFIVGAHVIQWGFQTDAPLFWWIYWGNDPLYLIYVPEDVLDPGGMNGYHLVTPSVLSFALSAFLWPFVHDFLPYGIAKISPGAMSVKEMEIHCRRIYADTSSWWVSFCQPLLGDPALDSFDEGTRRLSHELVEAITDPYPFFGWSDAGRQPAAEESEIGDICRNGPFPFGRYTLAASYSVATYWSNRDNACVPESRPSITLVRPANGEAITWAGPQGPEIFMSASATFPADGDPNAISWTLDGTTLPQTGTNVVSPHLTLGAHSVTVGAVDSQGLTASTSASFTVVASPPTCVIISPAAGASVAASTFVVRGDGTDPQDRSLPESAFKWKVNGIDAGIGRIVPASASLGPVSIVLDVTNSAGLHCTVTRGVVAVASTGVPGVTIISPPDGTLFPVPDTNIPPTIHFSAIATDVDGSLLTDPARITWTDTIAGGPANALGTGTSIDRALSGNNSSVTPHKVTCTVTGGTGATASYTITILVGQII